MEVLYKQQCDTLYRLLVLVVEELLTLQRVPGSANTGGGGGGGGALLDGGGGSFNGGSGGSGMLCICYQYQGILLGRWQE